MQSLTSYIPMDRRQTLANQQTLPEYASGSVLFADISGFTPLTDALTKELGQTRAAEAMTQQLNHFYTALIAEVHRYRGSVIGFVGDAITCWFDDASGLSATACGLAMQEAMEQFREVKTSGGAVIELAIKVAVVTGAVRRFVVGSPDIQLIDAMAGQTLDKMARAEKNATRGEVVIAEDIVTGFAEQLTVSEWRDDSKSEWRFAVVSAISISISILNVQPAPWPALPETPETLEMQAQSWLLPPVYERLIAGQGDFLAEFRPATALFLRFTGLNYESDSAAGQKLDRYIRWVQGVLARYEGYLIQLTIGDKGSFLYAAFGAPMAHDDDSVRAVRAALELVETSAEFSFLHPVQIGLAHGLMRAGSYGSPMRHTYGVISDKTVLAARLMGATEPGSILCDVEVYRHTEQVIKFETLEPIRVKGKVDLVQIYRPTTQLVEQPTRLQSRLVGRQQEVAALNAALETMICGGGSQIVIMQGEAGIGKSRLVAELARLLGERGLSQFVGAGQSIEQQTPYRAWRDILTSIFDIDDIDDLNEQHSRRQRMADVVQEVAPQQIERLPLLNDVLHLGFEENELTASLSAELRQQSLSLLIVALLRASTKKRPLIIVLEDAHWLDSLSWQLTETVARAFSVSQEPMLLLLVTRPLDESSLGAPTLRSLQEMPRSQTLTLQTLSPAETVQLAANRINADLPPALAQLVQNRANGNPFFAEELVLALRDQGLITVTGPITEDRQCLISGDFAESLRTLPNTLQGLILARIDRLSPEKQSILKVAAVIGRTFAITPLHYVLNHYTNLLSQALRDGLETLAAVELTNLETLQPELTYIFKHIITQEVAYQTLLFSQRRALHLRVAQWYESTFGGLGRIAPTDPLAPYYPLLVHHYHHAEEREPERHYARLAGERAAKQYANQEAIGYFTRALELTPETDHLARYELLLARENVYDWQGKREKQTEDLLALANLALALNDDVKKATVSLRQAHYARRTGDYPAALLAVQQAIANVAQLQEPAVEAEGYYVWGVTLRRQGAYEEAQQRLEQALTLAPASQQPKIEADSLQQLGNVNYYRGNLSVSSHYYQQALPIYRTALDRKGEADSLMMLAAVHTRLGDYLSGQNQYRKALSIYDMTGNRIGQTIALGNLGNNYCHLGEYEIARTYQQQALTISQEIGDREGESFAFCNLALLDYHLGDYERARNDCQQALALHDEIGDRSGEGYTLTYLAYTLADSGELQSATEAYQKAIQVRRELGEDKLVIDDLAGLARVAMREGNNKRAYTYVEEILAWIESHGTEGIEYPLQVYLTCYQVLHATSEGDSDALARADTILTTAHTMLQEQAAKIKDDALRGQFLQNVPFNREIIEAWESRATTEVISDQ
ncbi:MAG: tetratricopeptide repeat protein [Ardenticatenaceae bacterium]